MRQLADHCDPMWVIFNKELVTVVPAGLWMLYRALRGRTVFPSRGALALLIGVGLAVQLGANLGLQWALGVVGLAIAIPAVFGVMLTASAVLGNVFLGERVSRRSAAAVGLLLVSLAMLGAAIYAAVEPEASESTRIEPLLLALGIGVPCAAGAIYAMLTIAIRRTIAGPTPMSTILFTTTVMAVVSLGPLCVYRLGMRQLLDTPPPQLAWMLAAGTLNLIAFLAITKGLELTTVVHVNVLNATQVALAAVAGMALFDEPLTAWLITGVALTIVGVVMIDRPAEELEADQHT